jgi:hypothetical protein
MFRLTCFNYLVFLFFLYDKKEMKMNLIYTYLFYENIKLKINLN